MESQHAIRQVAGDNLIALDLFAGAGGISLGVEQAGYKTIFSVDNDAASVETLNINRSEFYPDLGPVEPLDITTLDPYRIMEQLGLREGDLDLLVGGPPCVAFSKSGFHLDYKREGRDPRANLLDDYFRFLSAFRPKAFMMENVFGLIYRNKSRVFFDRLVAGIRELGYSVTYDVLIAADYGVPQNRQRLFLIGAHDGRRLSLPSPTHWGDHERRVRTSKSANLLPHLTAGEALSGIHASPEPEEHVNGKYGHLLPEIPPGDNYLHYTAKKGHPAPLFEWRSRYWTFLLKLDPAKPSSTIQSQPGPYVGPFHWENRRLRVPELKRLQGFPDGYHFAGTRKQIQSQIGNSVPPPMSFAVAHHIKRQMTESGTADGIPATATQLSLIGNGE